MNNPLNRFEMLILESRIRHIVHNPRKILGELGLRQGENFLDIGCGTGFLIPAASEIVKDGVVYALDISPTYLARVSEKIRSRKMNNVVVLRASAEEMSGVPDNSIDKAVMFYSLHHFRDIELSLRKAYDKLVFGGSLMIVDPIGSRTFGHGTDPEEVLKISSEIGYSIEKYRRGLLSYKVILRKTPKLTVHHDNVL